MFIRLQEFKYQMVGRIVFVQYMLPKKGTTSNFWRTYLYSRH